LDNKLSKIRVKISEIVNQNPWWKHGEKFVILDKNLKEAKERPTFFAGEFSL